MSNKDHLDKETSASFDITLTGSSAKARSRFVAAVDRLGGNIVELINVPIEQRNSRLRAKISADGNLIEAITQKAIERLDNDSEFADRAISLHLGGLLRKQQNKDAVIEEAMEDLRISPPSGVQAETGGETLGDEFLDRFERHAEEASSEKLRQKWGKVLASEIRKPGTFSLKALRIVDELDAKTAQYFEHVCRSRIDSCIPKCLNAHLSFEMHMKLIEAGLMVESDLGLICVFRPLGSVGKKEVWFCYLGEYGLSFPKDVDFPRGNVLGTEPIVSHESAPAIPVYRLTEVGHAISSILPDHQEAALDQLISHMSPHLTDGVLSKYRRVPNSDQFERVS